MIFLFFFDAVLLCFTCVETLCALELVNLLCCAIPSVQIAVEWLRQGCSNATRSPVESCDSDCVLQVIFGTSHWNCCIKDAI